MKKYFNKFLYKEENSTLNLIIMYFPYQQIYISRDSEAQKKGEIHQHLSKIKYKEANKRIEELWNVSFLILGEIRSKSHQSCHLEVLEQILSC